MMLDRRFNGPPDSGNGGITCGLLAGTTDLPVAEVTLRLPPPLEVEMQVVDGELRHGSDVVATVTEGDITLQPPAPVSYQQAREAPSALGPHIHPFPTCFVCGVDRADGLRLLPGRVSDDLVATVWTPTESGEVMVWAALDCPGGWSADIPGRPMVLGRMACVIDAVPAVGQECLVQGWLVGGEGRKVFTGSALYDADGTVLAVAQATWITLQR
ncbi:MAG: hypothetical protein JWO22_3284 [Frankiales bacterium]|nr:hypothetical protein [Frankiales bacterium]